MLLTELTQKSMPSKVKWDSKCEKATSMLKSLLSQAPILSTPDWTKPFILQSDASAFGLEYVLSQINNLGEEHPIAFASKKFSPPEQNYFAIERKALAIVKGIQHYRIYLKGNPFVIQMDHNTLTHLANVKDSHGRLAWWALSLKHYQFKVEY